MSSLEADQETRPVSEMGGVTFEATDAPTPAAPELARGDAIGRYIVVDRIGSGGMGVVYSAYDPELDRRVALKLLRPQAAHGGATHARVRLVREAQAMAKLSHPNVLPVYDVGEHAELVFVALEYVDGQTLRAWLREETRRWQDILSVFVEAGRGLAAAHTEGLVHRDFKPDNVLIGRRGQVRVMDFGLARPAPDSLSIDDDDFTASGRRQLRPQGSLTMTGFVMGTPAYMAPEQHHSRSVDHRADQFSFCVALYEGLFGARPFTGKTIDELFADIARGDVKPPRDKNVPAWLRRAVLRGLAKDPDARWPSMRELLTALARDPGRRWRYAGWLLAVGAVGVAGTVVAVGAPAGQSRCEAAGTDIQRVWNDERRDGLKAAFLATGLPYAGAAWERAGAVLERYAQAWTVQRVDACEATHVRGEQSEARLDLRVACTKRRLAEFESLLDILHRADAAVVERSVRAAAGLPAVSRCADPEVLRSDVEPPSEPAAQAEADGIRDDLAKITALLAAAKPRDAADLARAVGERSDALGYAPLQAEAKLALASSLNASGEFEPAAARCREATLLAESLGMDRLGLQAHSLMTWILGGKLAKYEEAQREGELALAKLERVGHDEELAAGLYNRLGDIADQHGDFAAARDYTERAVALWQKIDPENPSYAYSVSNLGRIAFRERDFETARDHFQRGLDLAIGMYGDAHPEVARVMGNVSACLHALGRRAEAEAALERSLAILEQALGPEHPDVAPMVANLANSYFRRGDHERALAANRRALAIKTSTYGERHPRVGYTKNNEGMVLLAMGRAAEALASYRDATSIFDEALDPDHPAKIEPLLGIGETLVQMQDPEGAIDPLERALEISIKHEESPERLAPIQFILAKALHASEPRRDRQRAAALAAAARSGWEAAGASKEVQRLDRWLQTTADPE